MSIRTALSCFFLLFITSSFGQTFSITGKSVDAADTSSLIGVSAVLTGITDTNVKTGGATDADGRFEITNLTAGKYQLRLVYLGYMTATQQVTITDNNVDIGTVSMKTSSKELKGVTIKEKQIRVEQNGDTSSFKADGYKTNVDATAEDLVNKMPGISSDGTGVKVNGESVQQVYVDGKPFFGTDPSLALKNMPAEIIDKIQVFDKLSDQSTFTGFDDGSTQKTINIITKKNKSQGTFGKIYAGGGLDANSDGRYLGGGNLNFFNGNRRISILGLTNNINQQNFSAEDVLGISSGSGGGNRGGGGRGGGGGGNNFMAGQQGGISNTNSAGFNYSDNWGKKLKVTGSYFFNNTDNTTASETNRTYNDSLKNTYHELSSSEAINYNHRINMRLEYTIDSFNSIIFTPGISFQKNNTTSTTNAKSYLSDVLSSSTDNTNTANNNGYNSSNNLLIQHKFGKPRRTLSLNINSSINEKNGTGTYYSQNSFFNPDTSTLRDQHYNLYNHGYSISPNLTYTEPVGKKGQVMANYNPSFSRNSIDKETYDPATPGGLDYIILDTTFSNKYDNNYNTQRGGLSYRIGDKKLTFTAGANVQYAMLDGNQFFPNSFTLNKNFTSILPTAMLNYKYADGRNLRVMYRTSTQAPSISQLQNVLDVTNPLLLKTGNADLKQSYEQTIIVRYGLTKSKTARNFFLNLYANYVDDYITNSTIIPTTPHSYVDPVTNDSIIINRGSQLTRPVNLDGYWNARSFLTYGMPVDFIKSNLNLNGGFNFARTPGLINDVINYSNNYTPSAGMVLSSNISEKLDFTLSYNGSYNIVRNTSPQVNADNSYFNHTASFRINWVFAKNFVLNTNITDNYYTAFTSTADQNFVLWNAYLGYKLLKSNALEVRLTAFDLLNQNKSITNSVTATYNENNVTQVLKQYFMLQLTYTIRQFKGAAPSGMSTDDKPQMPPDGGFGPRPMGDGPPPMRRE